MMEPDNLSTTNTSSIMETTKTVGTREYVDAEGRCVMKKNQASRFICCICNKTFQRKPPCLQHLSVTHKLEVNEIKRVVNNAPSNCPHCGKHFNQKSNLYRHIRVTHGGEGLPTFRTVKTKDVKCPMCGLCFTSVSCVNRHIRLIHSYDLEQDGETPSSDLVTCHFCEMKFTVESKCVAHMSDFHHAVYSSCLNEDGQETKFYKCSLCDVQIELQAELKEHLIDVHGKKLNEFHVEVTSEAEDKNESDEIFNCDSCNSSFENEEMWRSHMKDQHKAFPDSCCPKCGDHSFKTINELKCHMIDVHSITVSKGTSKRVALRANAESLGLSCGEFRALEKIPDWLVKHGGGQVLVVVERTT